MGFISLLLGNKTLLFGVIFAVIIGSMGIYVRVLKHNVKELEAEKVTLTSQLAISQNSVMKLQSAIDEQNTAVQKMKTAADERAKANQVEITKAKAVADTYKQQATDILKSAAPQGQPKCDSANFLINQEIQRAK